MAYRSTKRGRPVERARRSRWNYGFHWMGRDDRGVSMWDGQPNALKWGTRIMTATGLSLLVAGAVTLLSGVAAPPPFIFLSVGALHSIVAYFMGRQLKRIGELATLEQASRDFGIEAGRINAAIESKGIKPRMIINGEAMFDPADLDQAAILLRSAAPPPDEELLRPAASGSSDSATLLQAIEGDLESEKRTSKAGLMGPEEDVTLKQGVGDA